MNAAGRHRVQRQVPHLAALAVYLQVLNITPLFTSPWYVRRVCCLSILANHSNATGTSARQLRRLKFAKRSEQFQRYHKSLIDQDSGYQTYLDSISCERCTAKVLKNNKLAG